MDKDFKIRPAHPDDIPALVQIGNDGHLTLLELGAVPGISSSDDDDEAEGDLREWLERGTLLVAADVAGRPLGYGGALPAGDCFHICELDVERGSQRRGIGRQLMLALIDEARRRAFSCVTLTTDRLVPFNAPFYATLGFRILDSDELSDRLREILASEARTGLDPMRRCAMRRDFAQDTGAELA